MTFWRRLWKKSGQLSTIEALLKTSIINQEKTMAILNELKIAVDDIAADAMEAHDEVLVAIEHIMQDVDLEANPDLKAAIESLRDSHASFTDSLKTLKDKVDEVTASGGPTE